jgi:hypothetical protein
MKGEGKYALIVKVRDSVNKNRGQWGVISPFCLWLLGEFSTFRFGYIILVVL